MSAQRTRRRSRRKFNTECKVLGLLDGRWEYLGDVNKDTFLDPKLVFRKLLRPKTPYDFSYKYESAVVVRRWEPNREGAILGTLGFRMEGDVVTGVYATGSNPPVRKTGNSRLYYVITTLFS